MKFTITNNGTQPLSVLYTDLFKIYTESDEGVTGDVVTLEPDTSITLDNVEAVHQIIPGPNIIPDDFEDGSEDLDDLSLEDEEDDDEDNLLSQEDFDLNELDSDRTPP